jgi:tight adherence protein C
MISTLSLVRWSIPCCFAIAITFAAYTILATPNGSSLRLGMRGLVRSRSLEQSGLWRAVEPSVRWIGVRVRPLLGHRFRDYLDRQILLAGDPLGLLSEELLALTLVVAAAGSALGAAGAWVSDRNVPVCCLLGTLLGALVPFLTLVNLQEERKKSVHNGLPVVIDLLSLALSAGIDLPGSIKQVVAKTSNPNDPLIEELNVILYELSVGKTRQDALKGFADRVPIEAVRDFVAAVVQAEERGTPLEEVLRIQAQTSRQRRSVRAEESAARAGVKMFGPLLIIFCVVMLLILAPLVMGLEQALFQG